MTYVRIGVDNLPEITDPGPGEHLWMFSVAFRMSDEIARALAEGKKPETTIFDHENVLTAPGPGCYKCELPFRRALYYRKCTGSMDPL